MIFQRIFIVGFILAVAISIVKSSNFVDYKQKTNQKSKSLLLGRPALIYSSGLNYDGKFNHKN